MRARAIDAGVPRHPLEIRLLAQRANRANVTFYAIDPREGPPSTIRSGRAARHAGAGSRAAGFAAGGLRELAGNTDGAVVLNTNDVKGGVSRIMSDLGSYYLSAVLLDQYEDGWALPFDYGPRQTSRRSRPARGPATSHRPRPKTAPARERLDFPPVSCRSRVERR